MAYERLEPFGPPATNLNAGLIAATYANAHRSKDTAAVKPQEMALGEFADSGKRGVREQTVEEQKMVLLTLAKASKKTSRGRL